MSRRNKWKRRREQWTPRLNQQSIEPVPSLVHFCQRFDRGYELARHTQEMCARLEALERGEITRLAIFMPPRHSKTYHVSERFPAWWLAKHPDQQIILASYGATLAERNSRRVRNLLQHPRWRYAAQLSSDSTAVSQWHTAQGGIVIAAGVGGAATGFGAHLMVIDDPVKDREEADSEVYRERVWEWWTEVARTRLMPGGRIVLCQTRWHEDDLAGRILASPGAGDWDVLTLPAIAEDNDQLGRPPGEALWPAWFPLEELRSIEQDSTPRGWSALYQQRPSAAEGALFKRSWWQWFDASDFEHEPLRASLISVDTAAKTGLHNDYSVASVWAERAGHYYVLEVWRGRLEYPDLKRQLRQLHERWKCPILIEDSSAGQSLIQDLRRPELVGAERFPALPVLPHKTNQQSKLARASVAARYVEAGNVHLLRSAAWTPLWIDEHAAFPTGTHDDQVDTTSQVLERLAGGPRFVFGAQGKLARAD